GPYVVHGDAPALVRGLRAAAEGDRDAHRARLLPPADERHRAVLADQAVGRARPLERVRLPFLLLLLPLALEVDGDVHGQQRLRARGRVAEHVLAERDVAAQDERGPRRPRDLAAVGELQLVPDGGAAGRADGRAAARRGGRDLGLLFRAEVGV